MYLHTFKYLHVIKCLHKGIMIKNKLFKTEVNDNLFTFFYLSSIKSVTLILFTLFNNTLFNGCVFFESFPIYYFI